MSTTGSDPSAWPRAAELALAGRWWRLARWQGVAAEQPVRHPYSAI
jgi:hypothetical protein